MAKSTKHEMKIKKILIILRRTQQHNHLFTMALYRSTCVSGHLQLRTGGFCWCKSQHALADGNQRIQIKEKTVEFSLHTHTPV